MPSRLAISSLSLGRAWLHSLTSKLDAAHRYGYSGIELFYEDLEYSARNNFGSSGFSDCLLAAKRIRKLCEERSLAIVSLGPFAHCEGLKTEDAQRRMFEKLDEWMALAEALGTDIIQIPSNFLSAENLVSDVDAMVTDLVEVADRGAKRNLRFAYESLCWGTHNDLWEHSWTLVKRVDRPNFGLCLDTFNIAGRVYADPTSASGVNPDGAEELRASVARLVADVDVRKIFYVEVVDAERLDPPLAQQAFFDGTQPARMNWSRNCRLFYGETERGAYLPILPIVKALLEKQGGLGFEGWVSFELFNRSLVQEGPKTPKEHAERGAAAWEKMKRDVVFETVDVDDKVRAKVKINGDSNGRMEDRADTKSGVKE